MGWVLVVIAFLIGIIIRPLLEALAKGETTNFSMNTKYFAFSCRIGKEETASSMSSSTNYGFQKMD